MWSVEFPATKFHGCWLNVFWFLCFVQYAGNKIRSGDALTITDSVDALGVPSLSNDISKIHLSESTNAGDRQEVEPVNASADTRVFSPPPELVNSLQRLEELHDAVNGKEVSPVYPLTDIGSGLQTLEWINNSKDSPQQQVADSKVAHNENEVDPVHADTQTGGNIHSLELTSSSEDTPQQHLTESTDQSDTVATTAYRSSWKGEEYLRWYIRVCHHKQVEDGPPVEPADFIAQQKQPQVLLATYPSGLVPPPLHFCSISKSCEL
jgi:hypothetical protein